MELKKVKLDDLVSPEYNPRKISNEEMAKLKRSITELGYSEPIIVNDVNNVIISGNQRYRALKELGTDEIEVIFIHEPVLAREKALNVALNKINGEFDDIKLQNIFSELEIDNFDVELTGFEVDLTSSDFWDEEFEEEEEDTTQVYDEPEIVRPRASFVLREGDEWKIGNYLFKVVSLGEFEENKKFSLKVNADTFTIMFEKIKGSTEQPVFDFLDENEKLKDRFRNNSLSKRW